MGLSGHTGPVGHDPPWQRGAGPTGPGSGPTGACPPGVLNGATGVVPVDPEVADLFRRAEAKGMIVADGEWFRRVLRDRDEFEDAVADYHDKLPRFAIFRSYKSRLAKLLFRANPWWKEDRKLRRDLESVFEADARIRRWN